MDFSFSPQQEMLRDTVRAFVRREVTPDLIRRCEEGRTPPLDTFRKVAEQGWLQIGLPEEYGRHGPADLGRVRLRPGGRCQPSLAGRPRAAHRRRLDADPEEHHRQAPRPLIAQGFFSTRSGKILPGDGGVSAERPKNSGEGMDVFQNVNLQGLRSTV
ncbi:MAG: acyl-CoA dehydrogenase family protein, partial [Clostridia bacterium]|nr:acyl-CoA dehydrogenase family protein [Clostridia bacterium]